MKKAMFFSVALLHVIIASANVSNHNQSKPGIKINDTITVQYIRSATVKINYKNIKILVDPILADKGTEPAILYSNDIKNPTSHLPFNKKQIIKDIRAVLLTHYHSDHFDAEAERILPRDILIFCQPGDNKKLKDKGFTNTQVIDSSFNWEGINISRFRASHYKGANGELPFGESSSWFLTTGNESIFITGDAIFDERLKASLHATQPKVIIANTGECQFTKQNPVLTPGATMTLTAAELKDITQFLPASTIVAVHMDGINHCSLTKAGLREYITNENLKERIMVPNEGDILFYRELIKDRRKQRSR
jgi:L-ascorbate metabolism protein UlaG (beta-lactamase superfamily)